MSVTIQLDLPESLIKQAREFGLLDDKHVAEWLAAEVRRRQAGQELKNILDEIRSAPGEQMTMEDINSEVRAARIERRKREAGR